MAGRAVTVADCARIVERGDPVRFKSAMAAPLAARWVLFQLYAYNLELARAPSVTAEPMIAQMRLQWWRDAVAEAGSGPAPAHEVMGPLAELIVRARLPVDVLDNMAQARFADTERAPFDDASALFAYLDATAGGLMWVCALALGAPAEAEPVVRLAGRASGMANYLQAASALEARGKAPLHDGRPSVVADLARQALGWLGEARAARKTVPSRALPALLAGWQAGRLLRLAMREPSRVADGRLHLSDFGRRGGLLWQSASGRW